MRIFEIADAEAQLALWKLVNDSVWTAIQTQQHEEAKQKAAAQQQKKAKRSKRVGKRIASASAPIPKIIPNTALLNPRINTPAIHSMGFKGELNKLDKFLAQNSVNKLTDISY